ncbi:MAG: RNA 2',3'-cyclic phosphodiesterase [Bacteroidales bacterium]|jgi:2'-5' RNA ligase|nr:RNA 2',3'-cyclic phosphodiesterase [Bacteroidales bacterium]
MKRVFAAIKVTPSEAFLSRYFALKKSLEGEKIKWVEPENIHITMKFFGETPEHHIPAIHAALGKAASMSGPFDFNITNTGIFGSSYKPRVIWFGIEPAGGIITLANIILDQLQEIGIDRDRQNFVPHLTIARIKYLENKNHFQEVISRHREGQIQKEEVNVFHLFESRLSPGGPKYTVLNSYLLK